MNKLQRLGQHLFAFPFQAKRSFPAPTLQRIQDAIASSEQRHRGEIRFVVEHGLDIGNVLHEVTARDRAADYFSELRVWDTADNTGILIYVLLAEHDIEILADRGINQKVTPDFWEQICNRLTQDFRQGQFEAGVLAAIAAMTDELVRHFPAAGHNPDELPDQPVVR